MTVIPILQTVNQKYYIVKFNNLFVTRQKEWTNDSKQCTNNQFFIKKK